MTRRIFLPFLLVGMLAGPPAWGASFGVVVCGSGGETPYRAQFAEWGERLKSVLVEALGYAPGRVWLLTESGKGDGVNGRAALVDVEDVLEQCARQVTEEDDLFVFLVGHGSYRLQVAKLNLPGPDLSASTLDRLLKPIRARQITVVNTASVSAAFVNVLSGSRRIVCTSTRSAEERNTTRFMAFFIQALEEGSADQNRDGRISVLEVCQQAALLTQVWYTGEGLIATEHALLDDNGDGLGTRLPVDGDVREGMGQDGDLASACFLKDYVFPEGTPDGLVEAYRTALGAVERLVRQKAETPQTAYARQLEVLLIRAARVHRQIRTFAQIQEKLQ